MDINNGIILKLFLVCSHIFGYYYCTKYAYISIEKNNDIISDIIYHLNHLQIRKGYLIINVEYSFDTEWHLYAIVSITSLIENSHNRSIWYNVYILVPPEFSNLARKRLYSLQTKYDRLSIIIDFFT